MKKLILSMCLAGFALAASAQKSEVNEAQNKWNIYDQFLNKPENPDQAKGNLGKPKTQVQTPGEGDQRRPGGTSGVGRRPGSGGGAGAGAGAGMQPQGGGQQAPKPARTYLERQLNELYEGIKHTDLAIVHEKSKTMPEAWAYRALFASSIAFVDTLDAANSKKYQAIAEEAIAKAKDLKPNNSVNENLKRAQGYIDDAELRRGSVAYNKKDYAAAFDIFNSIVAKNPNDTLMYVNIAVVAKEIKNYDAVYKNYRKAISMNAPDAAVYYGDMFKVATENQKDTTTAINILKEAQAKYPDEMFFITNEADLYIKNGNADKAFEVLDKLIAKDPKNPNFLRVKGDVLYNQAYDVTTAARKMEEAKKIKEADALLKTRNELLIKALETYIKVEALTPKDAELLKTMRNIYLALNNDAKVAEYNKKAEAAAN